MSKAVDCAEWTLPIDNGGSVLALAKHINPRIASSILYEDIAADKGQNERLGCGVNGGQIGVKANLSNPLYSSNDYVKSGAKPEGVIIKLVKAPKSA